MLKTIIRGIKQVKLRLQENEYVSKVNAIRTAEMRVYGRYVIIK